MSRSLTNWIDGFVQYTEGKGSPLLWRKWAAFSIIAAAVERKVWMTTAKGQLFPNMYVLLVGGAGAGKSLCTSTAYEFLEELTKDKGVHLAPSSVTKASLIDKLDSSERIIVRPQSNPPTVKFNSVAVVVNEFGVFLPAYDNEFMNTMTDLWDCKNYSETRRTSKLSIDIPAAQVNLFAATTPSYLNSFLPEGAWDQGFMSRVICVYATATEHTDLFAVFEMDGQLRKSLINDLIQINRMYGELSVTDEVKEAINAWARSGGQPAPMHPKLTHYNSRRAAHLLKLCMIAAIASDSERVITLDHFAEALDWLTEVEHAMGDIFKAMKTGGDGRVIEECYHFLMEMFMKDKKAVLEHRVYHFLQERTPAHNVPRIMEVMEKAGLMKKEFAEGGHLGYVPRGRVA